MNLLERYQQIHSLIETACVRAGRNHSEVNLIAVTKTHPPESVDPLARLGILDVGENKVQEAKAKIPQCSGRFRWHGIGHLQTNKVKEAVRLFSMIHSVDSIRLVQEIEKQCQLQSRHLPILLEVNVSGESSKFGIKPEEIEQVIHAVNDCSCLELQGLMTMAPYSEEPETARPFFRKLFQLRHNLEKNLNIRLPHLSMGMSGDFQVAIEEGATMIRIGSALMGERVSNRFRPIPNDE